MHIEENNILNIDQTILSILLIDQTTKKNIMWATDNYKKNGIGYEEKKPIEIDLIRGIEGNIIKLGTGKSKNEKTKRVREKAEVFTPSWMCNIQNNLIDERWFNQKGIFNRETKNSWRVNKKKIIFPKDKNWKDYVRDKRLEMTCGEAPYIVSRYDAVTGKKIPIQRRIGLLDRKLRVICENTTTKEEWIKWAETAYKSVYGYDWQGDNILIARENLLLTLLEYYKEMFNDNLEQSIIKKFAEIISWNIWQMDGVRGVIPNSCKNDEEKQISLFKPKKLKNNKCIGCETNDIHKHNGEYCKVMDWERKRKVKFVSLISKEN